MKEHGKLISVEFEPSYNFRFYKGVARVAGLQLKDTLFSKVHSVLTSQITVKLSQSKKEKRSKETTKFFVGGLGSRVNEKHLAAFFSQFGEIKEVSIMKNRMNMKSRGFGFIIFKEAEVESLTQEDSTYHRINGVLVECKLAIRKEDMFESKFLNLFVEDAKQSKLFSRQDTRTSSLDSQIVTNMKRSLLYNASQEA